MKREPQGTVWVEQQEADDESNRKLVWLREKASEALRYDRGTLALLCRPGITGTQFGLCDREDD